MPSDPFRSSWEKLARAERHFVELAEKIDDFVRDRETDGRRMFTFEMKYQPRSHCIVYMLSDIEPTDVEWGLILGDVLHNLRSSLDHLAWSLVVAGKRPPDTLSLREQNAVKFPIYRTRDKFNAAVRPRNPKKTPSCLPGISRKQTAFIRGLQPYRGGKRAEFHPFAILQRFSNDDKHRIVQLAFHRPYDPEVVFGNSRDFIRTRWTTPKVIRPELGVEVLRIYGRRDGPNPRVDVNIRSLAEVAIDGRFWITDAYTGCRDTIQQALYRLAPMIRG